MTSLQSLGIAGRVAAVLLIAALAGQACADPAAPAHSCRSPVRPADDQDDVRWQRFLVDVDGFRACISDFAEASRSAARAHDKAANAAVEDWNAFVRSDLNVPEDYPWPPRSAGTRP